MKVRLSDITTIQFGLYAKPKDQGDAVYLQAKHFDDYGLLTGDIDTHLHVDQKNGTHLLKEGEILLASKGYRNFAWTYEKNIGAAMASSIFFVIKPDLSKVIPEFLTTIFNMPQSQAHFQTLGAGSSIPSIRKSELEAFIIQLPTLEVQKKAVTLKHLHEQDMELTRKIVAEKEKVYQDVIKNLIHQNA